MLGSLPAQLKDDEVVLGLKQLSEWFARHEAACRAEVDRGMVRSLPIPAAVLTQVWLDESWRAALQDVVPAPIAANGRWAVPEGGFLRQVDPDRGGYGAGRARRRPMLSP